MNFSPQEPAARDVPLILSAAEAASVILFHNRQMRRVSKLAGDIAIGVVKGSDHLTPQQKSDALEKCLTQHAMHEARALELARELKRHAASTTTSHSRN